jgi:hypothetical protein
VREVDRDRRKRELIDGGRNEVADPDLPGQVGPGNALRARSKLQASRSGAGR